MSTTHLQTYTYIKTYPRHVHHHRRARHMPELHTQLRAQTDGAHHRGHTPLGVLKRALGVRGGRGHDALELVGAGLARRLRGGGRGGAIIGCIYAVKFMSIEIVKDKCNEYG